MADESGESSADPIDGLTLDEDFVRDAGPPRTFTRAATVTSLDDRRRRRSTRRRGGYAAALVVLGGAATSVALLASGHHHQSPTGSGPAGVRANAAHHITELSDQTYDRGHCYTWNQKLARTRAKEVGCAVPHLFEAVTEYTLPVADATGRYPSLARWRAIARMTCRAPVQRFLGYSLDPAGRFYAGLIEPVRSSWDLGDRHVACGINVHSIPRASGRFSATLPAFSGVAQRASQALLIPTGACIDFEAPGHHFGVVSCRKPHAAVVTGSATISSKSAQPPAGTAYEQPASSTCNQLAANFLHRRFANSVTVAAQGVPISAADWRVGIRTYNCVISYFDSTGHPRLVSGLAR